LFKDHLALPASLAGLLDVQKAGPGFVGRIPARFAHALGKTSADYAP